MPIPKPRPDEEHDAFVSRCHSALSSEFEDQDQRHAVCEGAWRKVHGGEAPKEMSHEHASVPFELKALDADAKEFTGLASTWDIDLQNDRIEPGAFKRTIDHWARAGKPMKLLNSHKKERCEDVIGEVKSMQETSDGLEVTAKMADTPQGNAVWNLIKNRLVDGLSIGYQAVPGKTRTEVKDVGGKKRSIRVLQEVKLHEISAVIFGANQNALITAVKSMAEEAGVPWKEEPPKEEADPEPTPEPTPEPEPEPEPETPKEPAAEPEPLPEEEVLASLEAQLEPLLEQKQTAVETDDFYEASRLTDAIKGLQDRIARQKTRVQKAKTKRESWAVDGKARLETERLLDTLLARDKLRRESQEVLDEIYAKRDRFETEAALDGMLARRAG